METDLSFYHPTDALLDAFTRLADPARCGARLTVDNLRDAEDPAFTLRVATFSSISFEQDEPETPRPRILLNFGAHGRELITSEVALRLASMLCGEAPSLFVDGDAERSRERISELLRQVEVKLVPTQVPSARRLAEVGAGSCKQRRLNSRGVDVNRNWDVAWAEGDEAEGSGQYRGPRAFSEPETRALARLATDWRPDVFADVRSGDRYMAMPYAHKASGPSNRGERQAMQAGLRAVTRMWQRAHPRLLAHGSVPAGPAASLGEEPYRATGTALDYMYMSAGVRRCYMLQVYGASTVYGVGGRPAHEAQPAQHGRHDVSRILHLETPRFVRTSSNQREPELASSFIAIQEEERAVRVGGSGLSAGLDSEEKPFDCVAFFNPTTFDEFEVTVNAWADALLVLIDSSLTPVLAS